MDAEVLLGDALAALPVRERDDPLFQIMAGRAVRQGHTIRVRRRASFAALPALAAIGAATTLLPAGRNHTQVSNPSANDALLRVADISQAQPDTGRDAAYWFVAFTTQQNMIDRVTGQMQHTAPAEFRQWLGHTTPSVAVTMGADGTELRRTQTAPYVLPSASTTRGLDVDWDGLYTLPTDEAPLRARLEVMFPANTDSGELGLWRSVGHLLGNSPAPPALRAGLYRVVAGLPGVTTSSGSDSTGRAALIASYAYPGSSAMSRYYVDPSSGQLLEVEEVSGGPADLAPAGTVTLREHFHSAGAVPDTHSTP